MASPLITALVVGSHNSLVTALTAWPVFYWGKDLHLSPVRPVRYFRDTWYIALLGMIVLSASPSVDNIDTDYRSHRCNAGVKTSLSTMAARLGWARRGVVASLYIRYCYRTWSTYRYRDTLIISYNVDMMQYLIYSFQLQINRYMLLKWTC